ncbi:4462_t:CDS:1, partial [Cetraspora pellucida]
KLEPLSTANFSKLDVILLNKIIIKKAAQLQSMCPSCTICVVNLIIIITDAVVKKVKVNVAVDAM